MKIFVLTTVHPLNDVRVFVKQISSFIDSGYEVICLTKRSKLKLDSRITHIQLSLGSIRIFRIILGNILSLCYCIRHKANIYLIHDPEGLLVGYVLQVYLKKSVVYDMHENVPAQILSKQWIPVVFRNLVSKVFSFLEKLLLKNIPVIFAERSYVNVYSYVKKYELIQNYPIISVLRNIKPALCNSEVFRVCYMGRVSHQRGFDVMIRSVEEMRNLGFRIEFHIIGESDFNIGKFKHRDNYFYGRLDSLSGFGIVKSCDVGFALLKNKPNYIDSLPTKMLEYLALDTVPVVSNFPFYISIIDKLNYGYYCDPNSVNAVVKILKFQLENRFKDEKKWSVLVNLSYTWEIEYNKLERFLKSVVLEGSNAS